MSKIRWKDWNPQRVKANIAGRVAENMEVACQFVIGQARERVPVRRGVTKAEIAFTIEIGAKGNVVEGIVGVKRGKAFYAKFLEFGTRKMPARPFLRPAVFENAREIVRIIAGR
jgi:HK97 gp10 family phage protein